MIILIYYGKTAHRTIGTDLGPCAQAGDMVHMIALREKAALLKVLKTNWALFFGPACDKFSKHFWWWRRFFFECTIPNKICNFAVWIYSPLLASPAMMIMRNIGTNFSLPIHFSVLKEKKHKHGDETLSTNL